MLRGFLEFALLTAMLYFSLSFKWMAMLAVAKGAVCGIKAVIRHRRCIASMAQPHRQRVARRIRERGPIWLAKADVSEFTEALPFMQLGALFLWFITGCQYLRNMVWATSIIAVTIKCLRIYWASKSDKNAGEIAPWAAWGVKRAKDFGSMVGNKCRGFVNYSDGSQDRRQTFGAWVSIAAFLLFVTFALRFPIFIFWALHFTGTRKGFRSRRVATPPAPPVSAGAAAVAPIAAQTATAPATATPAVPACSVSDEIVDRIVNAIARAPLAHSERLSNELFVALSQEAPGLQKFDGVIRSLVALSIPLY